MINNTELEKLRSDSARIYGRYCRMKESRDMLYGLKHSFIFMYLSTFALLPPIAQLFMLLIAAPVYAVLDWIKTQIMDEPELDLAKIYNMVAAQDVLLCLDYKLDDTRHSVIVKSDTHIYTLFIKEEFYEDLVYKYNNHSESYLFLPYQCMEGLVRDDGRSVAHVTCESLFVLDVFACSK